MHKLLARQVRRLLGGSIPPGLEAFVQAVDEAYRQFDGERELLESSLEVTSEELVERNRHLRDELQAGLGMQEKLEEELRERRRVEESLRRNVVRLDEAQRLSGMGYWEWNVRTGAAVWSSEMYRIFGYEPGSVTPSHRLFLSHVHPEDLRRLTRYVQSIRTGRSRAEEHGRGAGASAPRRACNFSRDRRLHPAHARASL